MSTESTHEITKWYFKFFDFLLLSLNFPEYLSGSGWFVLLSESHIELSEQVVGYEQLNNGDSGPEGK